MLVCVRVRGVPVRLITMGTMSTCVPRHCEWRAFAREVKLSVIRRWVSLRLLSVQYLHSST
jgi:hypothetical protein